MPRPAGNIIFAQNPSSIGHLEYVVAVGNEISRNPLDERRTGKDGSWFRLDWRPHTGLGRLLAAFGRLSHVADAFSRHPDAILPWVGLETHAMQTPYAVDAAGGGLNSAISRKMSATSVLGTATSAIWKAT